MVRLSLKWACAVSTALKNGSLQPCPSLLAAVPGPSCYPVVGTLPSYWSGKYEKYKYHRVLNQLHQEYGPLVKENFGGRTIVHVFQPEDIKTVYSYEGKYPIIPPLMETAGIYREQKGMSLGLGFTNGEEWYRLRSNSQQRMLRPKEVQHHLPGVNKIAQDFTARLEAVKYARINEVTDLATEIGRWNLEASAMLVIDKRLGGLEIDSQAEHISTNIVKANRVLFEHSGILKLSFPFYKYLSTPRWRKVVKAEDLIYGHAIRWVDEAILKFRIEVEKGTLTDDKFYFLSYLLSRTSLSLKDVAIISLSLLLDGLSTTSPTVLFCLYALAIDNRVQQNVYDEVTRVVGNDPSSPINAEHINKMPYLKAFVKETFRMWPNGTEVSRFTETDMELSGFKIPAGTHVDLNPSVHFRNPVHFPDPDKHIPERWLRNEELEATKNNKKSNEQLLGGDVQKMAEAAQKIHPYLLTPFGHGTRMCAGRRFAEQHIYVLLATILRKFRLDYPVDRRMEAVYHTLLFPDRPVRVKFLPRP